MGFAVVETVTVVEDLFGSVEADFVENFRASSDYDCLLPSKNGQLYDRLHFLLQKPFLS